MINRFLTAAVLVQLGAGLAFSQVNQLTDCEKKEGFSLLYDGTLASFKNNFVDYVKGSTTNTSLSSEWAVSAATGAIGIQNSTEDVRSKKIYKDFDLRMEYRCDANEGVFYRTLVNTDRAWQTGIEVAINNYTNENKDAPGAAYDLYSPKPNAYFLHNTGKWNQLRVVAKTDSIEHWVNGVKVVGFKLHSTGFWTAYAASKWNTAQTLTFKTPGNKAAGYITEGYLGLQADHGGKWEIRNFRISETPYHGVVHDATNFDLCKTTGMDDRSAAAPASDLRAALRRGEDGVSLEIAGMAVHEAALVTMDGKAYRASFAPGASETGFKGTFKTGLYFVRMKTAAGTVTRKLNLL